MGNIVEAGGFGDTRVPSHDEVEIIHGSGFNHCKRSKGQYYT